MNWNDLSMADRAAYIRLGIENGITDLNVIKGTYNKYAEGGLLNPYSAGSLIDAIYKNSKGEEYLGEPSHHYDFTISEEEANRLGYYPNKRGHRDDRVKKPAHPTHPSRGKWNSFEEFELTDKGMENPNYTLFGLNDGGQDPQAVMTYRGGIVLPEITVTPKKNYIHNPYDNINIYAKGGLMDDPPQDLPIAGPILLPPSLPVNKVTLKKPSVQTDNKESYFNDLTKWHEDWLSKRKDVLLKNIDTAIQYRNDYIEENKKLPNELLLQIPNDVNTVYNNLINNLKSTKEIYNSDTDLYHFPLPSKHNAITTLQSYKDIKDKTDIDKANIKLADKANKEYKDTRGFTGIYSKDDKSKIIYYPSYPIPSTMVHERTHALNAHPQEFEILRSINEHNSSIYRDGNNPDNYLDSPTEIYSRLNELRQTLLLDPTKKYNSIGDLFKDDKGNVNLDKINKIIKSEIWKNLYNRYNSDIFYHWLNDVANNDTFITNTDLIFS